MTIALLATGDELVDGDTLNTSHRLLARMMASEQLTIGFHMACRDNETAILDALQFLAPRHKTIIITGGLGPTSDDLTRFALARFLNEPLVEYAEAIDHIQQRLSRAHLLMNEGNRQQALFPSQTQLLPNPKGTALGGLLRRHHQHWILLPGPPHECMPMFEQYVLPELLSSQTLSNEILLKWRLFGVSESQIAEKLETALHGVACRTGYRCEIPYVEFKVRCDKNVETQVRTRVEPLVTPHIISPVEKRASVCLKEILDTLNYHITIRDSVSGGLLQTLLQTPGHQKSVSFDTASSDECMFTLTGLDDYWLARPSTGTSTIQIDYCLFGRSGTEVHSIPFFNPDTVRSFAVEWICYRLLSLMNEA